MGGAANNSANNYGFADRIRQHSVNTPHNLCFMKYVHNNATPHGRSATRVIFLGKATRFVSRVDPRLRDGNTRFARVLGAIVGFPGQDLP